MREPENKAMTLEKAGKYSLTGLFLLSTTASISDPFADANKGDDRLPGGDDYIHIRIQQRNGRKSLTTVQGIAADYDKRKLVRAFKRVRDRWTSP